MLLTYLLTLLKRQIRHISACSASGARIIAKKVQLQQIVSLHARAFQRARAWKLTVAAARIKMLMLLLMMMTTTLTLLIGVSLHCIWQQTSLAFSRMLYVSIRIFGSSVETVFYRLRQLSNIIAAIVCELDILVGLHVLSVRSLGTRTKFSQPGFCMYSDPTAWNCCLPCHLQTITQSNIFKRHLTSFLLTDSFSILLTLL